MNNTKQIENYIIRNPKKTNVVIAKKFKEGGSEFNILLDMPMKELAGLCGDRLTEAIIRVRDGNINITPGFDGEFGKIQIFDDNMVGAGKKEPAAKKQMGLF